MNPKYTEIENPSGNKMIMAEYENGVIHCFLADESNSDYQRYLRWLENPDAEQSGTL